MNANTVICANCREPMQLDPIGSGFSPRCPRCGPHVETMRAALELLRPLLVYPITPSKPKRRRFWKWAW